VPRLRLATRGSPLARWQAEWVGRRLGQAVELVIVETTGDRRQDVSLTAIGGQGVFVKEVEAAVLEGRADAAVHSAKDLPSETGPGLWLAAIGERDDPRDALVGSTLDRLPTAARVATGSVRRRAQLANLRPDLTFAELRGNIATRLAKAEGHDAIVVAAAALRRLGMADRITEAVDPELLVPQVGQGAIAVECRAGDAATREVLAAVDDPATRRAVTAERAFLATLGSGCSLPVGAYATSARPEGELSLLAVILSSDGRICLRHRQAGTDPEALGRSVARHLLVASGGAEVLGMAAEPLGE
jgi:hydroxymethylbilane synthase